MAVSKLGNRRAIRSPAPESLPANWRAVGPAPLLDGGTYINFLTEEEGEERILAAYGKNYDRLLEVKTKWDPGDPFRMNKNIRPLQSFHVGRQPDPIRIDQP